MAVALRSVGVSPGANSNSCVIVKPVGLTVGDLMIAQVVYRGETVYVTAPPEGWTSIGQIRITFTIDTASHLFYKIADAADVAAANFTFTPSQAESNKGAITAWTGHNPTTPINIYTGYAGQYSDASTTVTAPTITPPAADCMICFFCGIADDNAQSNYAIATSNPASWAEAYDLAGNLTLDLALALGYALRPETSATGAGTATTSGSDMNIGQLVAIAPAAAGWANIKYIRAGTGSITATDLSHIWFGTTPVAVADIENLNGVSV